MIDRLPMTFAARPMQGHRAWLDQPTFRRRSLAGNSARPIPNRVVEADAGKGSN